jgi:GTP-binding protein EngB required for normal cell division
VQYISGISTKRGNFQDAEYVVLLGDVGSGKSTVVEKLTGEKGRSSDASISFTKTSEAFCVPDGSLIISDTPGSNAMDDELEHNVWIAAAFNYKPVSRLFIVVKAEDRKDTVIDNISKYANRFLEPAEMDVLGVLVTHMDKVKWTAEELVPDVERKLGIDTVVFSSMDTTAEILLSNILTTCTKKHNLTVDGENFFKFFKLHNNHMKILRCTNDEVKRFSAMKKNFDEAIQGFTGKDLVDIFFEFQAYMADEIVQAQKRLAKKNNFTFYGDGAANEAGHVANMVNQLRTILYDVRAECVGFQSEHGVSELRKCPHCGLIWTKVEGCNGSTTCGNRPSNVNDIRDSAFSVLATFSFEWIGNKLNITKGGNKNVNSQKSSSSEFAGCGKTISWNEMATVAVPEEFSETVKICTSDIKMLPPVASGFQEDLSNLLQTATGAMKLSTKTKKPDPQFKNY